MNTIEESPHQDSNHKNDIVEQTSHSEAHTLSNTITLKDNIYSNDELSQSPDVSSVVSRLVLEEQRRIEETQNQEPVDTVPSELEEYGDVPVEEYDEPTTAPTATGQDINLTQEFSDLLSKQEDTTNVFDDTQDSLYEEEDSAINWETFKITDQYYVQDQDSEIWKFDQFACLHRPNLDKNRIQQLEQQYPQMPQFQVDAYLREAFHLFDQQFRVLKQYPFVYRQAEPYNSRAFHAAFVETPSYSGHSSVSTPQTSTSLIDSSAAPPTGAMSPQQQPQEEEQIEDDFMIVSTASLTLDALSKGIDFNPPIQHQSSFELSNINNTSGNRSSAEDAVSSSTSNLTDKKQSFFKSLLQKSADKRKNSAGDSVPSSANSSATGSPVVPNLALENVSPSGTIKRKDMKGTLTKRTGTGFSTPRSAAANQSKSSLNVFKKDGNEISAPGTASQSNVSTPQNGDENNGSPDDSEDDQESHFKNRFNKSLQEVQDMESVGLKLPLESTISPTATSSRRLVSLHNSEFRYKSEASQLGRRPFYLYPVKRTLKFSFVPKTISFERQFEEPLLCRVSIYNIVTDKKLTEDFHFFVGAKDLLRYLPNKLSTEILMAQQKGLFSLSHELTEQLVYVVQVDRILTSSLEDAVKIHSKALSTSEDSAFIHSFLTFSNKLGQFRQPFLWGYTPLCFADGQLKQNVIDISPLYRVRGEADNLHSIATAHATIQQQIAKKAKIVYQSVAATFAFEVELVSNHVTVSNDDYFVKEIDYSNLENENNTMTSLLDVNTSVFDDTNLSDDSISDRKNSEVDRKLSIADEDLIHSPHVIASPHMDSIINGDVPYIQTIKQEQREEANRMQGFHWIEEFSLSIPKTPFLNYINTVYIKPGSVNFHGISKAKHICVEMLFRDGDKEVNHIHGEDRIVGRFTAIQDIKRTNLIWSGVTYHQKSPQFFDEWKVELPCSIKPSHHFVFTFFTVSVGDLNLKKAEPLNEEVYGTAERMILGYSILPVINQDNSGSSVLMDQNFSLPVYKELRMGYLQPQVASKMETIVKTKFHVSSFGISSIYPKHNAVQQFIQLLNDMSFTQSNPIQLVEELLEACKSLSHSLNQPGQQTKFDTLIPHLPVLLNTLLRLLCTVDQFAKDNKSLVAKVQDAIISVVMELIRGTKESRGGAILSPYIQYVFDEETSDQQKCLFEWLPICLKNRLLQSSKFSSNNATTSVNSPLISSPQSNNASSPQLLSKKKKSNLKTLTSNDDEVQQGEVRKVMITCWFFFDLLIKSITLYNNHSAEQTTKNGLPNRVIGYESGWNLPTDFTTHMQQFVQQFATQLLVLVNSNQDDATQLAKTANRNLALLMNDLVTILHRDDLASIIQQYCETMSSTASRVLSLKLEFFQFLLMESKDLIGYCVPRHLSPDQPSFIMLLCQVLSEGLRKLESKTITVLMQWCSKLDYDDRYQESSTKQMIAETLLPVMEQVLLPFLSANCEECKEYVAVDGFVLFLWILRNLSPLRLQNWCKRLSVEQMDQFLQCYSQMVLCFAYSNQIKSQTVQQEAFVCMIDVLTIVMQQLISKFGSINNLELEPDLAHLMDQTCHVLFHLLMSCRVIKDNPTVLNKLFEHVIYSFVKQCHSLLIVDTSALIGGKKMNSVQRKRREQKWRVLVAPLFALTESPFQEKAHPFLAKSLELLTGMYCNPNHYLLVQTSNTAEEEDDNNMVYESETTNDLIRGATLSKLIERLILNKSQDKERHYQKIFLLTYYSFTKPNELIQQLIRYYHTQQDETAKLKMLSFMVDWVKNGFHDFDNFTIAVLVRFLDLEIVVKNNSVSQKKLKKLMCKEMLHIETNNVKVLGQAPDVKVPPNFNVKQMMKPKIPLEQFLKSKKLFSNPFDYPFELMEWPSIELARQLTLIESNLFAKIEPKECFGLAWSKAKELAPNITAISERFNLVSGWVMTTILKEPDLKKRQMILLKMIDIMKYLREQNNFVSLNQFNAGLNNAAVYRLKHTFSVVKGESKTIFEEVQHLFSGGQSFPHMRKELQEILPQAAVPFIGMYLTDLTFIEDGNKDMISHPKKEDLMMINFKKRRLYSETIMKIQQLQQTPYNFQILPYLQYVLTEEIFKEIYDDKKAFAVSLRVEPRE